MIQLQKRAIITSLTVSTWSGRKYDKAVSEEVDSLHNAEDGGRYNKRLVTLEEIGPVTRAARELRDFHIKNTLPWEDRGGRLLPTTNYFQYKEKLTDLQYAFEQRVTEFIRDWETIQGNNRIRLNGLYKPGDFPTQQQLREKFGAKFTVLPVPETHFSNLEGVNGDIEELREQAEKEIQKRYEDAGKDNWLRVKAQIVRMKNILMEEDTRIHGSLMGSLEELVTLIPRLNISEDQQLTDICEDLKKVLVPVEDLRKSTDLRVEKYQELEQISKKFAQYF